MEAHEIRIAIVHDDRLYRECLAQFLSRQNDMDVVCSSSYLCADHYTWLTCAPTVVLAQFWMNRSQPEIDVSQIRAHSAKKIVLGVPDTDGDILSCIEQVGASGFVFADDSPVDLIEQIHAVMRGQTLCSPRIANLAFTRMSVLARQHTPMQVAPSRTCLTKRESEITKLIDEGLSNKEIAVQLHIEVSTVKNHVHNILDKLQIHNRHSVAKSVKTRTFSTVNHS